MNRKSSLFSFLTEAEGREMSQGVCSNSSPATNLLLKAQTNSNLIRRLRHLANILEADSALDEWDVFGNTLENKLTST